LTEGFVRFKCTVNGRFVLAGQDCKAPGQVCASTKYGIELNGNHHTYVLPSTGAGETSQNCYFGEFTEGDINFKCSADGKWSLGGHSCKKPGVPQPTCAAKTMTVQVGDGSHDFKLLASDAGEVDRPCDFGDHTEGKIKFQCGTDGAWTLISHECKQPGGSAGEVCKETSATIGLNGVTHTYDLPSSPAAETSRDCQFGAWDEGQVVFECGGDGRWKVKGHSCKDSSSTCKNTRFWIRGLAGPESKILFTLIASPPGPQLATCGEGSNGEGQVEFECQSNGGWKYKSGTCALT